MNLKLIHSMSVISIDGAYGEGGGQIIRSTIALSALTMKPVIIKNIRAGRPQPGLKRQHIAGVELTGTLVNAEISGLEIGSTDLKFVPTERRGGHFKYDVGTAGAISLVLQAILPAAVLSPEKVHFKITGGTDVSWSPPIDYMKNILSPMLKQVGLSVHIDQEKRGHYPRGGGLVNCSVESTTEVTPLYAVKFGELEEINGISHCVRLPAHVASRQASAAKTELSGISPIVKIYEETYPKERDTHLGPGSGIVLWGKSDSGFRIGADALGDRGKRAEIVGEEAARQLKDEIGVGYAIGSHLSDMLVPFLAIATGISTIGITKVTSHLTTNLWVNERILGVKTHLSGKMGEPGVLEIEGVGLTSTQ